MGFLRKFILWKLSIIYRIAIFFWDLYWNIAKQVKLPCKVISVGNITVGGTGKTPVVRYIAHLAAESGYKTSVVARGYKRKAKGLIEVNDNSRWQEVGDEPLEIYRLTEGIRVYVHQSKTVAACKACDDGADVIIIDDGFQHRKLHRDIDLVCLDYRSPFGPDGMLPLGLLREPEGNLKRADIALFTNCEKSIQPARSFKFTKPVFHSRTEIINFINIKTHETKQLESLIPGKILAFSGLANPSKFKNSLKKAGFGSTKIVSFPDHHEYTEGEINLLIKDAENSSVDYLMTTYKDAVKIESFDFGNFDIYSAMIDIRIVDKDGIDCRERLKELLGL